MFNILLNNLQFFEYSSRNFTMNRRRHGFFAHVCKKKKKGKKKEKGTEEERSRVYVVKVKVVEPRRHRGYKIGHVSI